MNKVKECVYARILGTSEFRVKALKILCVLFTNREQQFCEFCAYYAHFFRIEKVQIYIHFALTLNDIRINRKM